MNGLLPCGSLPEDFYRTYLDNDELRLKILRLIEANPSMSQRQIAGELGVSLGGVNYCLRALVEFGWIKVGNFAKSDHKLGYLYLLTPRGIREKTKITASFLAKKRHEYEVLRQEILRLEVELANESQTDNSIHD